MEDVTLEQEIAEVIEALRSQEGRTLLEFLDATAPRLHEIHQDLAALNASLSETLSKLESLKEDKSDVRFRPRKNKEAS